MNTRQARRAYLSSKRAPRLSKAEQARIDREEQEAIRKELAQKRDRSRAQAARERKRAREEEDRRERKRRGQPIIDARASQASISWFARGRVCGVELKGSDGWGVLGKVKEEDAPGEEEEDKENREPEQAKAGEGEAWEERKHSLASSMQRDEKKGTEENDQPNLWDLLGISSQDLYSGIDDLFASPSQLVREVQEVSRPPVTVEPSRPLQDTGSVNASPKPRKPVPTVEINMPKPSTPLRHATTTVGTGTQSAAKPPTLGQQRDPPTLKLNARPALRPTPRNGRSPGISGEHGARPQGMPPQRRSTTSTGRRTHVAPSLRGHAPHPQDKPQMAPPRPPQTRHQRPVVVHSTHRPPPPSSKPPHKEIAEPPAIIDEFLFLSTQDLEFSEDELTAIETPQRPVPRKQERPRPLPPVPPFAAPTKLSGPPGLPTLQSARTSRVREPDTYDFSFLSTQDLELSDDENDILTKKTPQSPARQQPDKPPTGRSAPYVLAPATFVTSARQSTQKPKHKETGASEFEFISTQDLEFSEDELLEIQAPQRPVQAKPKPNGPSVPPASETPMPPPPLAPRPRAPRQESLLPEVEGPDIDESTFLSTQDIELFSDNLEPQPAARRPSEPSPLPTHAKVRAARPRSNSAHIPGPPQSPRPEPSPAPEVPADTDVDVDIDGLGGAPRRFFTETGTQELLCLAIDRSRRTAAREALQRSMAPKAGPKRTKETASARDQRQGQKGVQESGNQERVQPGRDAKNRPVHHQPVLDKRHNGRQEQSVEDLPTHRQAEGIVNRQDEEEKWWGELEDDDWDAVLLGI